MSLSYQLSGSSGLATNGNFFPPAVPLPASTLKFSRFSEKFPGGVNWVPRRRRICVKSGDSDAGSDESTRTISRKEVAGSADPAGTSSSSFLSVLCPLLKLFSGGDPSRERNQILEVATSSLASLARLPWGSRASPRDLNDEEIPPSPPLSLELFEFEACPFCRRVREALTELDLSVEVYPCPKGSVRHREMVRRFGGKEQFPFLVDPNTGTKLYESGDIVKYLIEKYGGQRSLSTGLLESTLFTGWMPTILRAGRGMVLWENAAAEPPQKMLELFSYENNLYARLVRETLCELELPYILHNVGEGSVRKKLLLNASGSDKVPFLVDPNTGTQTGDYKKIIAYLFDTYSTTTAKV